MARPSSATFHEYKIPREVPRNAVLSREYKCPTIIPVYAFHLSKRNHKPTNLNTFTAINGQNERCIRVGC